MALFIFPVILVACGTAEDTGSEGDIIVNDNHIQTIVPGNNQLAFNMLKLTEKNEEGNRFLSPASLYMALSMVYNGANGETKKELNEVLGLPDGDSGELNQSNQAFIELLTTEKAGIQLDVANSLWLNEVFHFQSAFRGNTTDYYDATIEEINMKDPSAVERINQWVAHHTNEKITDIVEAPLNPDLVTLLINTIYFDGDWMYPFKPELTAPADFYLSDGSTKKVEMMQLAEELNYFETEAFQAVALPYGEGELSMQLFLPAENKNFEEFQTSITPKNWETWQASFAEEEGRVLLPAFQVEYETSLVEMLQSLGVENAFSEQADFSKMVEETDCVRISDVKQKTFIEVDEEGTEAAAATSVEMVITSAPVNQPFQMELNRPFFLFITEEETGAILFAGAIENPPVRD